MDAGLKTARRIDKFPNAKFRGHIRRFAAKFRRSTAIRSVFRLSATFNDQKHRCSELEKTINQGPTAAQAYVEGRTRVSLPLCLLTTPRDLQLDKQGYLR